VAEQDLTVAVTGPTGDLGIEIVNQLEKSRAVKKIVGMARSSFDPASEGWKKTEYRQGDVTDPASVKDAIKGADVVVHLAFSIMGSGDQTRQINVEGSRKVFEACVKSRKVRRLCYASSVAAYGYHAENPKWLTEEVPALGTREHYYSAQKAEVESVLEDTLAGKSATQAYVFRPCIVAGPRAQMMLEEIPLLQISERMPDALRAFLNLMPVLKPVIPDPGTPFQLVHEHDVATAFSAGVRGVGEPGAYNLAGGGTLRMKDFAEALGWYSVPVPEVALDTTAEVIQRLPVDAEKASWVEAFRNPVLMKTDRAKKKLRWKPKYTSKQTLRATVDAFRATQHER
jgi:nucleoside-diphosphate-sugar epimerase